MAEEFTAGDGAFASLSVENLLGGGLAEDGGGAGGKRKHDAAHLNHLGDRVDDLGLELGKVG